MRDFSLLTNDELKEQLAHYQDQVRRFNTLVAAVQMEQYRRLSGFERKMFGESEAYGNDCVNGKCDV